jgi:hypothetical protein
MSAAMLAITSHGNAPYLMAARLAQALGSRTVLIPDYYGEVQRRIMRDELGCAIQNIYLSKELGDLMRPLLLDKSTGLSFVDFASNLADDTHPRGIASVEAALNRMLHEGIPAESLDGSRQRVFRAADFDLAVNMAEPLLVDLPHQVFVFTGLLSRIYGTLPPGVNDSESLAVVEKLQPFARKWARCEKGCDVRFVPRIHACSYDPKPLPGVTPIAPLAGRRTPAHIVDRPGVLFSPSGTGTDAAKLTHLACSLSTGQQAFVLAGGQAETDFIQAGALPVCGSAYADSKIHWVAARGGWGTIWECLQNEKPPVLVRTTFIEDPEMGHTQASLKKLGLARIYSGDGDDLPSTAEVDRIRERIHAERAIDRAAFGDLADDGYACLAQKLNEYLQ